VRQLSLADHRKIDAGADCGTPKEEQGRARREVSSLQNFVITTRK
jgi:hypothetical protein